MDDAGGWGEGGSVEGQPGTGIRHREYGELRARFKDPKEYLYCWV